MELWTLLIVGLIVLPIVGLVVLAADLIDGYGDMIFISEFYAKETVEYEQTKHNILSQLARAITMMLIALMAFLELIDVLTADMLVTIIYLIAMTKVADAWRSRRSRKRMVNIAKASNSHNQKP